MVYGNGGVLPTPNPLFNMDNSVAGILLLRASCDIPLVLPAISTGVFWNRYEIIWLERVDDGIEYLALAAYGRIDR